MENRRKIHEELEVVKEGFANGVAPGFPLDNLQKQYMIEDAAEAFGNFLTALKCDWKNDPNSAETPKRVAKAYVNDLWAGRYTAMSPITSFPSDGYDGIIIERNIPLTSMCSHHHQTIGGVVHIGYIVGEEGRVIGLSKLNRIVELFGLPNVALNVSTSDTNGTSLTHTGNSSSENNFNCLLILFYFGIS